MGAGDALGRDAQASSATRRNGVIYQGTEKGNVSEREVEERKSSLQDVQKWQVRIDTDRKPMGKCESVNR
jgi:hypothetical protein